MLRISDIQNAYIALKQYCYYDNLNLFLRYRIAEFEEESFQQGNIEDVFEKILNVLNSKYPLENEDFKLWLSKVDYHILPKTIEQAGEFSEQQKADKGLFISNVKTFSTYNVTKINYFINAPVELHILDILWCFSTGFILEKKVHPSNYGNRLHNSAKKFFTNKPDNPKIFKRYIDQYNKWRDSAIDTARKIVKNDEDVAIFSLDLQSFFYYISTDFGKIQKEIESCDLENIKNISKQLTYILEKIFKKYTSTIEKRFARTHPRCKTYDTLPIGLASSAIIANWHLTEFDESITSITRPDYYGRYVDDILMVFKNPIIEPENTIEKFIERYLSDSLIKGKEDYLTSETSIPVQKSKLILQHYSSSHSKAGLELFKQELEERSSAFKFLPDEHIENDLDKYAYDILYDGSANKLRSIVGLSENATELSKYLSSHIMAYKLCEKKTDNIIPQLRDFFKGQNALLFYRLWEKLYQFAIATKNLSLLKEFYQSLSREINKIEGWYLKSDGGLYKNKGHEYSQKIQKDLVCYNQLSLSISLGLLDIEELGKKKEIPIRNIENLLIYAKFFRYSNLIRHHLVGWPLANYTSFEGDLTSEKKFQESDNKKFDKRKITLSPRFIHSDEKQVYTLGKEIQNGSFEGNWFPILKDCSEVITETDDRKSLQNIKVQHLKISNHKSDFGKLKIAIANLKVNDDDIENAIRQDKKPNVSFERQKSLYRILNSVIENNTDLVVLPEVSVPVAWLPFMVSFSRRHQVGIIFGLEHWIGQEKAYNLLIELLPFKASHKYKSCAITARIKNHYAPAETELLENVRLEVGIPEKHYYHKVSWRGVTFASYNCFELSDITHRGIFRSEIDLLIACVWNRDTNYYQHILESAVRDIHCYVIQVNTSQYGGSCVLQPSKTEKKSILHVKGGENPCILTASLDVQKLRDFQFKSHPDKHKDAFKHLPPGYNSDIVKER